MAVENFIDTPAAPNLPIAPMVYERQFQEAFNNVLRLYFNRLDNALRTAFGEEGGQYINNPNGAFQNNGNVTLAAINTPTLVPFTVTDFATGMYSVPGDGVHVEQSGLYNYQFSIQFQNTDTQIHDAFVWLRLNGVDLPWTGSAFSITSSHGGVPGYVIGAANFYVQMAAGDYVEMWWAANDLAVTMHSLAPTTTPYIRPGSPSVVSTLTFVSSY